MATVLGLGLTLVGLLVELRAVVIAVRMRRLSRVSPFPAPNRSLARALYGQIKRNTVDEDTDPAMLRWYASSIRDQRWQRWFAGGLALLWVGLAVAEPATWRFAIAGLLIANYLAAIVVTTRVMARADAFLRDQPPAAGEADRGIAGPG